MHIPGIAKSLTDNGGGDTTVTFNDSFGRAGVTIVGCSNHSNLGSFGNVVSTTNLATQVRSTRYDGVTVDQPYDFLTVGFDSFVDDYLPRNHSTVLFNMINSRLLPFHIQGTGTPEILASAKHGALVKNSTGDYSLTFTNQFARQPLFFATPIGTAARAVCRDAADNTYARITTHTQTPVAADCDFYLWLIGQDSKDTSPRRRLALKVPHSGARLLIFEITITGGVPAITKGQGSATITDNDTGDFSLTFANPFKRAPSVMATADGSFMAQCKTAATTTAVNIVTFSNAGVAADAGKANVLVLGYDDVSEH